MKTTSPMEIITLPDDLQQKHIQNIGAFNYYTRQDLERSRISLSHNTISFLRSGTKEIFGDDAATQIDNHSFLVMKSGNCLMTEKVSTVDKTYHSTLLFFSDKLILDFLERYDADAVALSSSKSFHVFSYDLFLKQFLNSLDELLKLPAATQQVLLQPKFEELMLYLTHKHSSHFLRALIEGKQPATSQLSRIVENNKYNRLSLVELAFLCNMSVSTFKRAFAQQYHQSPMKWFNKQRMDRSAYLLRTKRRRPMDIYEEAGYENYSNFVQAFKKEFGQTPRQYQNQS